MLQQHWKTVWQFLKQLNIDLPYNPEITILGTCPREWKHMSKKVYANDHGRIILSSQKVETTGTSMWWVDKSNMIYPFNGILFGNEKK